MPVVEAALKKVIAVAVIGTIAKLIAAKVGMSVGTALTFVLIPVIFVFLVRDILNFPERLSIALADAVCIEMRTTYSKGMSEIVSQLLANCAANLSVEELAKAVTCSSEAMKAIGDLVMAAMS